jgi:broad specificity phosphatase PhoE
MKKIILIRHGQSTGDIEKRYGGHYDDELTPEGVHQAELLGEKAIVQSVKAIYSSPLKRARATAQTLAERVKLPVCIVPELIECNRYGVISGMTKVEALEQHPAEVAIVNERMKTLTGGESYGAFVVRVKDTLQELQQRDGVDTIALITHGGFFRVVFREILNAGEISIGDCAVAVLSYDEGSLSILSLDGVTLAEQ